jgi:hypothetical protein
MPGCSFRKLERGSPDAAHKESPRTSGIVYKPQAVTSISSILQSQFDKDRAKQAQPNKHNLKLIRARNTHLHRLHSSLNLHLPYPYRAMTTTTHLPKAYLLLFTLIDIVSPTLGVLTYFFALSLTAASPFPPPGFALPLTIWAACLAGLQITNLYIRRDFSRQKQIQTAAAVMDCFLLGLYVWTKMKGGKNSVSDWESGDWLRVGVYAGLALGRASYVVGGEEDAVQTSEGKKGL